MYVNCSTGSVEPVLTLDQTTFIYMFTLRLHMGKLQTIFFVQLTTPCNDLVYIILTIMIFQKQYFYQSNVHIIQCHNEIN